MRWEMKTCCRPTVDTHFFRINSHFLLHLSLNYRRRYEQHFVRAFLPRHHRDLGGWPPPGRRGAPAGGLRPLVPLRGPRHQPDPAHLPAPVRRPGERHPALRHRGLQQGGRGLQQRIKVRNHSNLGANVLLIRTLSVSITYCGIRYGIFF